MEKMTICNVKGFTHGHKPTDNYHFLAALLGLLTSSAHCLVLQHTTCELD